MIFSDGSGGRNLPEIYKADSAGGGDICARSKTGAAAAGGARRGKGFYRTAAEVAELVRAFESCALPLAEWTPRSYLSVALWYLYLNPLGEATRLMRGALECYAARRGIAVGGARDRHEKLMIFWLCAVNDYVRRHRDRHSFVGLANGLLERFANPALPPVSCSRKQLYLPVTRRKDGRWRTANVSGRDLRTGEAAAGAEGAFISVFRGAAFETPEFLNSGGESAAAEDGKLDIPDRDFVV